MRKASWLETFVFSLFDYFTVHTNVNVGLCLINFDSKEI